MFAYFLTVLASAPNTDNEGKKDLFRLMVSEVLVHCGGRMW